MKTSAQFKSHQLVNDTKYSIVFFIPESQPCNFVKGIFIINFLKTLKLTYLMHNQYHMLNIRTIRNFRVSFLPSFM